MKFNGTMKFLSLSLLGLVWNFNLQAQTYQLNKNATSVLVEGTSNIHDWHIEAESCSGTITLETDEGKIDDIEKLQFSVEAESLKSGKSGMDKNTYKALNTGDHKNIVFRMEKVNSMKETAAGTYLVKASGKLEIAGVKRDTELQFTLKTASDRVELQGSKDIDMTAYQIEPPSAMFGTITTGKMVTVKFKTIFRK
ncbi:YceI family protein [Christiangramia flava]|uniref:Uncharacterized protein n=1 Tax=Christiangramia flava JLT2011 TaxID=1229726 RepID=A0A1L7I3Y8_9FLAO|nr:YceI family protein [Christiangramia flava]APU68327.1 hypothetical protein GRFL_1603 [Christiangramia flava JLT2011]OSS40886.1 hypothetical protein C723_0295 [Christiangramia flava JLT2011]